MLPLITERSISKPAAAVPRPAARHKPSWNRRVAILGRWLHIYLSMASFAILFFFAVTGLTLNHPDWFTGHEKAVHVTGQMDTQWFKNTQAAQISRLEVVEYLRLTGGYTQVFRDLTMRKVAADAASKSGVKITDSELQEAADGFRARYQLNSAKDTHTWLKVSGLTVEQFEKYL